jgi:TonB-linked SusC/RagA family outer membrane protein
MKYLNLIALALLFTVSTVFAQTKVSGTVKSESGDPLIGANIVVKGSVPLVGTASDAEGNYQIDVPQGYTVLVFSYTGYTEQEKEISGQASIDVILSEGVMKDDVIVTALGVSRQEKVLGYAVSSLSGDEISGSNTPNMINAISGKISGVQVTSSSGAAGAASRIIVRGQSTFDGNNEALMVVDGVRISNAENHSERSLGGVANSNRAIDINPNDIESITVLKGAAASALYGAEGSKGVVIITTKKGKSTKELKNGIAVDFNSTYTISQVNKLPELQKKWAQGTGWYSADGVTPEYFGPETGWPTSWGPSIDSLRYDGATDYDYDVNGRIVGQSDPTATSQAVTPYDNLSSFFRNGNMWRNDLAVSGGGDVATYRLSFSNLSENGVIPNNSFGKTNVGLSSTAKFLKDKLKLSTTINYTNSGGTRIQQGSNISGLMLGLLRTPATFDNTGGVDDPVNNSASYYRSNGRQRNYRGGGGYDNPFWTVNNTLFNDRVNRVFGSFQAAYKFSDLLTISTNIGTDVYSDHRTQEFELYSRAFPGGRVMDDQYNFKNIDAYLNVSGTKTFAEKHSLSYNLGINHYETYLQNTLVIGDGLAFPGFVHLANTSSVSTVNSTSRQRNFGFFGNIEYGFNNMLYLTVTGRNDFLSSLISYDRDFKAADVSVFYPSVSTSFVFSEIIPQNKILSFGKLRLSFAQVGGGAPGAYLTSTAFTTPANGTINAIADGWTNGIIFPFNGLTGFTYNSLAGNGTLQPSLTTDFETGLDLRFLNGRIRLDASFYTRTSKNQIISIAIAPSTGFQRAVLNNGTLSTTGVDLELNTTPVKTKGFSWDLGVNFTKWNTIVKDLPDNVEYQYLDGFTGSSIYNIEGQRYGVIQGGAFMRANDAAGTGYDVNLPYNPDGALIIGADGYPMVDPLERVLGDPNPDFLMGITNTLCYKGVELSFLFDIKQGGDMWNGTKGALTYFGMSKLTENRDMPFQDPATGSLTFTGFNEAGAPVTSTVLADENWYTGNGGGFGDVAEGFIEDASWYRLRQLSLTYNFTPKMLEKTPLRGLSIGFVGRNLLLFTPYTGIDPETSLVGSSSNGQGLDYFQLPNTRSFAISLGVKF